MPSFDSYVQDINNQGNAASTADEVKDLVDWYGATLHRLIEDGFYDGKKGKTTGGKHPIATVKKGQISKADETTIENKTSTVVKTSQKASITGTAPASLKKLKTKVAKLGKDDEADADAEAKAGNGEEASELYVDAAIERFREAMCVYWSADFSTAIATKAQEVQDYADALRTAAELLKKAADNEGTDDHEILEIVAESIAAKAFTDAAILLVNDFTAKGGKFRAGVDPGAQAQKAQTAAVDLLKGYVK